MEIKVERPSSGLPLRVRMSGASAGLMLRSMVEACFNVVNDFEEGKREEVDIMSEEVYGNYSYHEDSPECLIVKNLKQYDRPF